MGILSVHEKQKLCRLWIKRHHGSGPTIGVSQRGADVSFGNCVDGGFATRAGGWGLCLESGRLWSAGEIAGQIEYRGGFSGRTVRMQIDLTSGMLSFVLEGDPEVHLGEVQVPVAHWRRGGHPRDTLSSSTENNDVLREASQEFLPANRCLPGRGDLAPLAFTLSACCMNTEYHVLGWAKCDWGSHLRSTQLHCKGRRGEPC